MMRLLGLWLVASGMLFASGASDEQMAAPLVPVPEQFLSAYFGKRPQQFLIDPQQLLRGREARERSEFLNYHSGDSEIDLYVYLFKGDQSLPESVSVVADVERAFARGRPAVVVHYFMGRPDRAALYLSPGLDEVIPLIEQGRALESSVEQASLDATPVNQLEKFTVQMAIRIYWMERLLHRHAALAEEGVDSREIEVQPKPRNGGADSLLDVLLATWRTYRMPLVGLVLFASVALLLRLRYRRRAQYRFADLEVEERLGGPHAAGIGAVISFANASLSPTAQQDR